MIRERLTITLCIVIATLVLFSSLHSAQVIGAAFTANQDAKKAAAHDDVSLVKLSSDLHHHSDKSGAQLVKDPGDQQQVYADNRTLRLLRHKRTLSIRDRLEASWLRALNELHSFTA